MGSSLLHQKLQMLNCCIRHKVTRQKSNGPAARATTTITPATSTTSTSTSTTASATKPVAPLTSNSVSLASVRKSSVADSGESEEDEFYEALESQDSDLRAPPNTSPLPSHPSPVHARKSGRVTAMEEMVGGSDPLTLLSYNEEEEGGSSKLRVGALKPCGDLLLLATGEPLYIPVTQVEPLYIPVTQVEPLYIPVTQVEPLYVPITQVEPLYIPVTQPTDFCVEGRGGVCPLCGPVNWS